MALLCVCAPQSIMCMRHLGNVLYSRLIFCTTTKSKLISFCKQSRNCTEKEKTERERERKRARMCSVAHSHIYSSIFYSIELLKCLRSREHLHIGPRCLKLQYICRILLCQSQYCRRVEWTGIFINECNKDSQFTVYNTWNCRIKTAINELMNRMLVRLCVVPLHFHCAVFQWFQWCVRSVRICVCLCIGMCSYRESTGNHSLSLLPLFRLSYAFKLYNSSINSFIVVVYVFLNNTLGLKGIF